ncbi:type II toxin-antitoxin system PemK/MazF family toxin [Sphingomonas sp. MMS24-JH45]
MAGRARQTKPRPCVIVQHTATLAEPSKLTACPMTSASGAYSLRPAVEPSADNGLRLRSHVEIDWIFTERTERFGPVIGRLDPDTLAAVDLALRRWLDL